MAVDSYAWRLHNYASSDIRIRAFGVGGLVALCTASPFVARATIVYIVPSVRHRTDTDC